jgi:hypothetical protein
MKVRVIIFVTLALVTLLCCKFFSHPASSSKMGVVVWLPEKYGNYSSEKINISELERKWLPGDTTNYKRRYTDQALLDYLNSNDEFSEDSKEGIKAYNSLNVTLIVAGSDSRSLHNPEVCLTAQSWTIEKKAVTTLETEGGPLDVMNLYLKRTLVDADRQIIKNSDGSDRTHRAIYTFWWVGPKNTTPYLEKRTWLALWNSVLTGEQERWAYPSCMAYVDDKRGSEFTQKRIDDFIIKFAPSFQKSLGAKDREDAIKPYDL